MSVRINMLDGRLWDKILLFALPLAASMVLQQLFNSADVAVVGRWAGSVAQAAVGANTAIINLLITMFVGVSVGANAVIAQYIGEGARQRIQDAVHTVITLSLLSGLFLLVFGLIVARPVLQWMDTPDDVLESAILYFRIYFLGMPFIMLYNFGSAVLRSKGDSRRPLYSLTAGGIINVLLNMLLVCVFEMGVAGVAIATVVSNAVSALMVFDFLLHETPNFQLHPRQLRIRRDALLHVLRIGLPAGVQGMMFSISNVIIQTAINSFGAQGVAGSTAAWTYEAMTWFIINAFAQTAVTFTAQNYGARNHHRCRRVFWLCQGFGLSLCALAGLVCWLLADPLVRVYTVDEAVVMFGITRISHVLAFEFLTGTFDITGSCLRGMGWSMLPAFITVAGTCVFRLAWVWYVFPGSGSFGLLLDVYPASWIATGVVMLTAYFIISRKELRKIFS